MWNINFQDELYHHGIKGQRWGVRRYQNEDGTLTVAGKKRYSKNEIKEIQDNINDLKSQTINECNKKLNKTIGVYKNYLKSMDEDINKTINDKKARSDAYNKMKKYLGSPETVDDDELIEYAASEVAASIVKESNKTTMLSKAVDKAHEEYMNSVEEYADGLLTYSKNFSNKKIEKVGKEAYNNIINNANVGISQLNNITDSYYSSNAYHNLCDVIVKDFMSEGSLYKVKNRYGA